IEYYTLALEHARATNYWSGEVHDLGRLGHTYSTMERYKEAIPFLEQALAVRRKVQQPQGIIDALWELARATGNSGDFPRARDLYQEAIDLAREVSDAPREQTLLANIGWVYGQLGEPERNVESLTGALELAHTHGDKASEATYAGNLGSIYLE